MGVKNIQQSYFYFRKLIQYLCGIYTRKISKDSGRKVRKKEKLWIEFSKISPVKRDTGTS